MISFQIDDMHCGHCVRSITQAVNGVAPTARLHFDLQAKRVNIDPAGAGADKLAEAIRAAGYSPVPVQASPEPAGAAGAAGRRGCCCA